MNSKWVVRLPALIGAFFPVYAFAKVLTTVQRQRATRPASRSRRTPFTTGYPEASG